MPSKSLKDQISRKLFNPYDFNGLFEHINSKRKRKIKLEEYKQALIELVKEGKLWNVNAQ